MEIKSVGILGAFNDRTGYGIHTTNFATALEKLVPLVRNNKGDVNITLIDSVSIQNIKERLPYPSICYNAWESTLQPDWFIDRLKLFDQLWVPSEWQRSCSIAQGIPEEFVKVVPEGVDPNVYKPLDNIPSSDVFTFVHVGQWQPRKSTLEIIRAFLKAFPNTGKGCLNVQLQLSVDTLFPSDEFKSTEERLAHYGINDPRISVIHFEERSAYLRRLQSANCFVSCSRSEGWGLPIAEAMACGIPTIVADWGGSTEYAGRAINVRIRELRKPQGIYGNWDVPGQWAEPDYDHLVECMQDVAKNYSSHKKVALETSSTIRTKFSWDAAARRAVDIIKEIPDRPPVTQPVAIIDESDPEKAVQRYARKFGYDVVSMKKRNAIFTIDTHPSSQDKMDTLIETIKQVKKLGFPVLVSSHYPLPAVVIEMVDFYIYDRRDVLSGTDLPIYWRKHADGREETTKSSIPCHAVASTINVRNAVDFCLGKYDWMYHICYDTEVDLNEWIKKVNASDKDLIGARWDGQPNTFSGQLFAGKLSVLDKIILKTTTWEEFAAIHGAKRFNSEEVFLERIAKEVGLKNVDIIDIQLGNRFDQVDRDAWPDDMFACHFVGGPYLNISGISNREYEVSFGNPVDGEGYYRLAQKVGMWSQPNLKFYRDWTVRAYLNKELKFEHRIDLSGKRVLVPMGSRALGDTLAWMPYIDAFRKKHNCTVISSTWWNKIMDYPEIQFVEPGTVVENIYANYDIGCFDNQPDKNPVNWRLCPLQKVAADILGLDYEPLRCKLKVIPPASGIIPKHVCFSEFSTMRNKFWNNDGAWQVVIDYLNSLGYECWSISAEKSQLKNIIPHNGQSIENTLTDIATASFYVGLNHGPSWIAYSLGIPYVMITGVSEEWNDPVNPYRISLEICKPGCFNDPAIPIDRGWDWCPRKRDFACTREITPEMVIGKIDQLIKEHGL